jgi:hypothetical protein
MSGAVPPLHQYTFMAWYLVKHRDNFTFIRKKGGRVIFVKKYNGLYIALNKNCNTVTLLEPFPTSTSLLIAFV